MDNSLQNQMFLALVLSCLRSSVEKRTLDFIELKKFQAYWVMYVPPFTFISYLLLLNFYKDSYVFIYQAWTLWREEKLQDLMDSSLCDTYDAYQFIRCSQIGLLCVQDEPDDRPHMSNVVTMLDNETTILSIPKQPTFFTRKTLSNTASSSVQLESSIQEGR